jgi:hypothetical protein
MGRQWQGTWWSAENQPERLTGVRMISWPMKQHGNKKDLNNEQTYFSAQQLETQTYPWLPGKDEDPFRPSHTQCPSGEGAKTSFRLIP